VDAYLNACIEMRHMTKGEIRSGYQIFVICNFIIRHSIRYIMSLKRKVVLVGIG